MTTGRLLRTLSILTGLLLVAIALGLILGSESIDIGPALRGEGADGIILRTRLPRVLLACIVGAALAVSGASLQALVENPLADPFILGLSGGAAIGATTVIAAGLTHLAGGSLVGFAGFGGALLAAFVVFSLGRVHGRLIPERMLLVGVVFNAFASAAIMAIESLIAPDLLQNVLDWLLGSIGYPTGASLTAAAVVTAVGVGALIGFAPALNLLSLGELDAHGLGVNVARARRLVFLCSALLVAAAVSMTGVVGFVGLIVPHLVRLAFGSDHRLVIPGSALGGAAFLVLADLGSRLIFRFAHSLPPVGMVTALIGAPLFLYLLLRRTRRSEQ